MADPLTDKDLLEQAMEKVEELQALADKYGIDDIFQDNGGKVLQTLIILGLKPLPGREGNDAIDAQGNEYELKTVNLLKTRSISTHHHLNPGILSKYRQVAAWYFSFYRGIKLQQIYRVETADLEEIFSKWEAKIIAEGKQLNNAKIPVTLVRRVGKLVYSSGTSAPPPPSVSEVEADVQHSIEEIEVGAPEAASGE